MFIYGEELISFSQLSVTCLQQKYTFQCQKHKIRGAYLLSEKVAKTKNLKMECLA